MNPRVDEAVVTANNQAEKSGHDLAQNPGGTFGTKPEATWPKIPLLGGLVRPLREPLGGLLEGVVGVSGGLCHC